MQLHTKLVSFSLFFFTFSCALVLSVQQQVKKLCICSWNCKIQTKRSVAGEASSRLIPQDTVIWKRNNQSQLSLNISNKTISTTFWIFYRTSSGVRGCKGKWKRKWHHQPLCHFVYFLYVLSNFNHSEFWRSSECVLHIITHCVIRVLPDLHVSPCKANSFIKKIVNICSMLEICVTLTQCLKHFYLFLDKLDKRAKAGEKWSKHAGKQFDQWSFKATSSTASVKN